MKTVFERFVSKVVKQTDGNAAEREDLTEELLSHLYCAYEDLRKQGFSYGEAVELAMASFGNEKEEVSNFSKRCILSQRCTAV
ncbi:hypothetical protein CSV74_11560 [Sporosarcina sp. P19]|uniref:permease prefix domain 1-containing protein n=1 Tax=Sporosarcina sp. P19 TaxID=2048258 RepID=UPI000C166453|nr:permease prefix domain 1-containing protein [Sporosarcina sp. P19]PIC76363.1 hypothetical protein CSV74_11560 [Sporosarcina sp. P19]